MVKNEDRKYQTKKYPAPGAHGCTIEWLAQLHRIGKQEAYFSITGEERDPTKRGDDNQIISCGCLHDPLERVALEGKDVLLRRLVRWHLTSVTKGPMHYEANSLFHLKEGKLDYFRSACVFGAVEGDVMPTDEESARTFLRGRFTALMAKFEADMAELFGEDVRC